jgi:L-asparaginase
MVHVVVLATGGTIASSGGSDGAAVANRGASDLLAGITGGPVTVEARDLFQLGSYLLEHRHLRMVCEAVAGELAHPEVDGVVITHGTDTMEETAYLLDLVHAGEKPAVFTGAQRPADAPDTDGPANLRAAIAAAASPQTRGLGVLISFAGRLFAARGTRKGHTIAPEPFCTPGSGPLGTVSPAVVDGGDAVRLAATPRRPAALPGPTEAFDTTRVDVVSMYPGADAALPAAAVDAGAAGVVIAGTGMGNGNHAVVSWVREAVRAGVAVGLSSRVAAGPVVPVYGNGGAVDLVRAGAVPLGTLPLYQARILLALQLSAGTPVTPESVRPFI